MTRKLTTFLVALALFGPLVTGVLAGQSTPSSPALLCHEMTSDYRGKTKTMEQSDHNCGKCMTQMMDACGRTMKNSKEANPCESRQGTADR